MKTLIRTLTVKLASAAPAFAAGARDGKGTSILIALFLGFAALVVLFQFIPGLVLFASMLKGLFTSVTKKASQTTPGGAARK